MAGAGKADVASSQSASVCTGAAEDANEGPTLADLCPNDKAKVGNLLRKLARAQRDGQTASAERQEYRDRLLKLRSQNNEIVQVTGVAALPHLPTRPMSTRLASDHQHMLQWHRAHRKR